MLFCDKLGQFFGLPNFPKGDRDGIETGLSYYSNAAFDNQEGNTGFHRPVGGPEQVYLVVLRLTATFLQSIENSRCKGLRARMCGSLLGH